MKTESHLIVFTILLVSATLFLIYQIPDEIPKPSSLEKHSGEIVQINEKSKRYQLIDDVQKFNESKKLMQEKLKEISFDYLKIKISNVTLLDGYYPFRDVNYRIEKFDIDPSSICEFEQKIPLHMQKISQTDHFQIFAKKYSSYPMELTIFDERNDISNIHYGLIASNDKNQSASTYFHFDSCTNERTDKKPFHLYCFDGNNDYKFATSNYDLVMSNYSNDHFCKMELDSWRQSLYDYSKTLQEKQRQLEIKSMESIVDQESQWMFLSEMNKQGELRGLVGYMIHNDFDEQNLQEKIEQYERKYGSLPDELLELIENR
jgi:hypothetical protein